MQGVEEDIWLKRYGVICDAHMVPKYQGDPQEERSLASYLILVSFQSELLQTSLWCGNQSSPGLATEGSLYHTLLPGVEFPPAALALREGCGEGAAESLPGHLGLHHRVSHLGLGGVLGGGWELGEGQEAAGHLEGGGELGLQEGRCPDWVGDRPRAAGEAGLGGGSFLRSILDGFNLSHPPSLSLSFSHTQTLSHTQTHTFTYRLVKSQCVPAACDT